MFLSVKKIDLQYRFVSSLDMRSHPFLLHTRYRRWHPKVVYELREDVNCTQIVMANGVSHIGGRDRCDLCGRKDKVKLACTMKECYESGGKLVPYRFHITCARQAGLDVHDDDQDQEVPFQVKCFHHVRNAEVLRARMEDMIEVERHRAGKSLQNSGLPMTFVDASRLMHWSVTILANLGWAWKWADWWVERGDNWEPLLEPWQKEEKMSKEQLKIVDSTPESRCADARKCRLAAFGAALRNRDYDKDEGDDKVELDNALRAILATPSLVGPLQPHEIDFFAEWLGRAYRSKSPLLGFGDDKIPVDAHVCTHIQDGSPKYELGNRHLPGKPVPELAEGDPYDEVDDFLLRDKQVPAEMGKTAQGPARGRRKRSNSEVNSVENSTPTSIRSSAAAKYTADTADEDVKTKRASKPSSVDCEAVEKMKPAKRAKRSAQRQSSTSTSSSTEAPAGEDGTIPKPKGRMPRGFDWDYKEGVWKNKKGEVWQRTGRKNPY